MARFKLSTNMGMLELGDALSGAAPLLFLTVNNA
jgi:hypothetical protein